MNNMDLQSAISTALGNGGWVITEGGAWLTVGYAKTGVVVNKLQKKGSGEQPLRCLTEWNIAISRSCNELHGYEVLE